LAGADLPDGNEWGNILLNRAINRVILRFRRIDQIAYKLYGLTKEKIAIVECDYRGKL